MKMYQGGLGEASGHWLASTAPVFLRGDVWYVNSATGTDGVSPRGLDRTRPLATLAQAVTNSSGNDVIVLMDGHAEVRTTVQTINKTLAIVGGGSNAGVPTVTLTRNSASAILLSVTAADCVIGGIKFAGDQQSNSSPIVNIAAGDCAIENCYFTGDALTTVEMLRVNATADNSSVRDTTFLAGGASLAAQSYAAIKNSGGCANFKLEGVVIDGGQFGWSRPYALDLSAGDMTNLVAKQCSLLRGSDVSLTSTTTGYVNFAFTSGGPRIAW